MIAIIDYGAGNLFSIERAFRVLGADIHITNNKNDIYISEKIILPGVGAFGDCMKRLENTGLIPILKDAISNGTPLLGICVGLQILFDESEESPGIDGLGILHGRVQRIKSQGEKIPHMGWNSLSIYKNREDEYLLTDLPPSPYVYFVHSYHAVPVDHSIITSTSFYGEYITASISTKNIMATQFHPEKSGDIGLKILKNFINF